MFRLGRGGWCYCRGKLVWVVEESGLFGVGIGVCF